MKQALKKITPAPWWAALRRLVYPDRFHLHPLFSRYFPERGSLAAWAGYELGFYWWRYTRGRGQRLLRPIFLIGCARSGTSVSVRLFTMHPDVANLSEAPEIWDPRHYRDPDADHYWPAARATAAEAARLHARFEYHRRRAGKARLVNKHPRSSLRLEYIRTIFPDAVFIHVIRDPRAVVASMLEFLQARPWFQQERMPFFHPVNWRELVREDRVEQLALQWRAIVSHVLDRREELGAAYHEFKYEELCAAPRSVLGAAFRSAGLRADDEVLARLPERLDSQNYKWKRQLAPPQIETINRITATFRERLGYFDS